MVKRIFCLATRLLALSLLIQLSLSTLLGQSIEVKAPREYEAGRPFTVVYSINSSVDVDVLQNPSFSGLELLYGPALSSSQSYNIINGRASSSSRTELTYTLIASREGVYNISGLRLKVDGKELSSRSVSIKISGGASRSSRASSSSEQDDSNYRSSEQAAYKYHAIVPRRTVYVQEALPIIYRLQSTERPNISNTKPSVYDGFVSLDLLGSEPRQMTIERIGGRDWVVVDVMKELLFAQHAGELTIPSNELPIIYTLRDPSGDPFLNQTTERLLHSEPIKISVKALPEVGKPDDFSGAVGAFTARYDLGSTQWRTNEAVSFKLILEGQGNLKIAKLPKITLPNDVEVYDPVEKSEQSYSNGVLRSVRTIEYNLIPRNTGKLRIPSVSLSYFNPSTAQYQTTSTKSLDVNIVQGRVADEDKAIVATQSDEHSPYTLVDSLVEPQTFEIGFLKLLLLHLALILIAILVLKLVSQRSARRADSVGYAESRANRVATKRLKLAYQHLQSRQAEAYHEELLNALWGYLGDKLRLSRSVLNRDNVSTHLRERGISQEIIQELTDTLDAVEYARFAPSATQHDTHEQLYHQAVRLITSIETAPTKH